MSDTSTSRPSDAGSNTSDGSRNDDAGSRPDYATNQQAADRLDSRGESNSDDDTGGYSGQDAADKLDKGIYGGGSDVIPPPETGTSDTPASGGSAPSDAGDSYGKSEPYSTLPRGGPPERVSEIRPPSGPPVGNDESEKNKFRPLPPEKSG